MGCVYTWWWGSLFIIPILQVSKARVSVFLFKVPELVRGVAETLSDKFCYLFESMYVGSGEEIVLCIPEILSHGAEMARAESSWSRMLSMNL